MHGRHRALQVAHTAHTLLSNYSYEFRLNVSVPKVEAEGEIKNRFKNA